MLTIWKPLQLSNAWHPAVHRDRNCQKAFSPNWFKFFSELALQLILFSVKKELVIQLWLIIKFTTISEMNIIISFLIILQTRTVWTSAFYYMALFLFCHVVKCAESLLFIFHHRKKLSLTWGSGLFIINDIHSSNRVVSPFTSVSAGTTASSKGAT